jgi:DNA-binding GntR family transcriptional regulator
MIGGAAILHFGPPDDNRPIVEALERHDGPAARRAIVAHFEGTREQVRAAGAAGGPQRVQD